MSGNSLDGLEQVVEIADRFEAAWRQGLRPQIEEFLAAAPAAVRAELAHDLLGIELELRRQGGESPQPEEYWDRFPLDRRLVDAVFASGCGSGERPAVRSGPEHSPGSTMPAVPGYQIVRLLGSGGFSEVWLAEDLNLFQRPVALKMIKHRMLPERRRSAVRALRNEVELLVRVRHPNLVQVLGWVESDQDPVLVLQYVPGGSLADRLLREGRLEWPTATRYVADVAEGLLAVHARGIIHRDVKPANILWDPEIDEALLTDLGVGVRLAEPRGLGGTVPYMAPEAFDGQVSSALDVYGLAASLFTLVTGQRPFPGPAIADLRLQARQGLPQPDSRCAGLPEPLERIVRAGLTAEPASRPDLNEFVATLRGALNRLLADALAMKKSAPRPDATTEPGPEPAADAPPPPRLPAVRVRLIVSRQTGPNKFVPVAASETAIDLPATRDTKTVPPAPERIRLQTGDRVRIEVTADNAGYLTVFNVGPTGNLSLLYPDESLRGTVFAAPVVPANRTVQVLDVEMTPPAGQERLFAVWTRMPPPLRLDRLQSLVEQAGKKTLASQPYLATRDMKRVQQSIEPLSPEDWHAVVLELEQAP
jgi:serine/threonine protein kinase